MTKRQAASVSLIFLSSLLLLFAYGCGTVSSSSSGSSAATVAIIYQHCFGDYSGPNSSCEVMTMRSDGSGSFKLTDLPSVSAYSYYPAMSPDGTKVAYVVYVGGFTTSLEVVGIDGSGRKTVASNKDYFCWSPDSKKIAFSSNSGAIEVRDVEAMTAPVSVTHEAAGNRRFSWSSDGSMFAYVVQNSLWVAYMNGTSVTSIEEVIGTSMSPRYPLFSPVDRDKLALLYAFDLAVFDMALRERTTLETDPLNTWDKAWSNDGQWIYYPKYGTGGDFDLWRASITGTVAESLTDDILSTAGITQTKPDEQRPRVFPGSRAVFFSVTPKDKNYSSSEVYSMSPDGTNKVRLTNDMHFDGTDVTISF